MTEADQMLFRGVQPVLGIEGIWPSRDAVRVHAQKPNEVEGTVIVYTVPADKKMYLSNLILSGYQSEAQETRAKVSVRNGADEIQYCVAEVRFGAAGQLNVPCHFVPALELNTGWDVVLINEFL